MVLTMHSGNSRTALILISLVLTLLLQAGSLPGWGASESRAQELTPAMIDEAVRRTGLSRSEVKRMYAERQGGAVANQETEIPAQMEPGRSSIDGIDDSRPPRDPRRLTLTDRMGEVSPAAVLPFDLMLARQDSLAQAGLDSLLSGMYETPIFGHDFFQLDEGLFVPPTFGPVPADYQLGVGDEVVVDVWGGVEFRLSRLVDRDGAVILPQVGKISCVGRTLDQVTTEILEKLTSIHSSIDKDGPGQGDDGDTFVEISMGSLRGIRVFVIGEVTRPGSYELSSLSTVLGALYSAGGPADSGSLREVRLVRQGKVVDTLDLYDYLLNGVRQGDRRLREGDTVLIPGRGPTVQVEGEVNRPIRFEMKTGENLEQLVTYAGGFTAFAAPASIHLRRIVPLADRKAGQPDLVILDVPYGSIPVELFDGDHVRVDAIEDRIENWVEVTGMVKQPGIYQFKPGMTASGLISLAGGLWPDALTERATIDRTSTDKQFTSFSFDLRAEMLDPQGSVGLQAMDVVQIFSRWEVQNRPMVSITGEIFKPMELEYREGITLRDLILKSGGMKQSADFLLAEISRVRLEAIQSTDTENRPSQTVEVIPVQLGHDFLTTDESFILMPHDRVAIRKLPWWELQQTVTVTGEVFYPGVFSLERKDETISALIGRAGGIKPDAYLVGARIIRKLDGVGNIAIDLLKALESPGSQYDLVLQHGDEILIPDRMYTVKVMGEVGFPTSLIFEADKDIDYYVNRAGGYLEQADEDKSRVVWPNGMSLPNKGGSQVVAGSTIIVPIKPPPEGPSKLETMKEITAILAGLATVWLVIDATGN